MKKLKIAALKPPEGYPQIRLPIGRSSRQQGSSSTPSENTSLTLETSQKLLVGPLGGQIILIIINYAKDYPNTHYYAKAYHMQ